MSKDKLSGYLEFKGPAVDQGKMDVGQAGRALVALSKLFDNYVKAQKREDLRKVIDFKINALKKGSTEIVVCLQELAPVVQPLVSTATAVLIADAIGLKELGKSFFSTVGQQLALKLFSKGKALEEKSRSVLDGNVVIVLKNSDGKEKTVSQISWDQFKINQPLIRDLIPLEEKKTESLRVGYFDSPKEKVEVAHVTYQQKKELSFDDDFLPARERFNEDFNDEDAVDIKLVGKFMDYYGRAQKYHFSFQTRKKQDETGRQYILCIVPQDKIDELIDHLKPSHKKNICIFGKATKDSDGKIDKIKIRYISEDEDFNPEQVTLLQY